MDKGDVSLVTHGANPNTRMGLTPALEALAARRHGLELRSLDDPVGPHRGPLPDRPAALAAGTSDRARTMTLREAMRMVNGLA
jgi:hypothetical protein